MQIREPQLRPPESEIGGRAQQSDLTSPPGDSDTCSDLEASAQNRAHFIPVFECIVITL